MTFTCQALKCRKKQLPLLWLVIFWTETLGTLGDPTREASKKYSEKRQSRQRDVCMIELLRVSCAASSGYEMPELGFWWKSVLDNRRLI